MDLESSSGYIYRKQRIGVLSKGKQTYMDRRLIFTNKKRLKGKKISITESLTKTGMSALKETRNKFGYKSD